MFAVVCAAVLAAEAVVAVVHTRSVPDPGLVIADDALIQFCWGAPTPTDWAAQSTGGLTYGLDVVELSGDGPVRVDSVTIEDPAGGMTLLRAAFVPGAEVADGLPGPAGLRTTNPVLAGLARTAPTTLTPTPLPASEDASIWHPRDWQLAVTVSAPVDVTEAGTPGFTITYERDGRLTRLTTKEPVRAANTPHGCSEGAVTAGPTERPQV